MRIAGITPELNKPVTVVTDGETISAIEEGINRPDLGSEDLYLSSGMIDLMVPGYGGVSFRNADLTESGIRTVLQGLYARGTTHFYPLVATTTSEAYQKILPTIDRFARQDAQGKSIPGVHIEGPYLSEEPGFCGAHNPELMHDPDFEEFKNWCDLSGDRVAILTLAPERVGSVAFIRQARQWGVKVALGHTAATAAQMGAAITAGADISTHLGNGAPSMIHRWDSFLFRQLADDRLWAMVIADGDHLPDSNLRIWFRTKGLQRLILVSDIAEQAGLPAGIYQRPDATEVRVEENGRISVTDESGSLAGAGHGLDRCVAKAASLGEFTLAECLLMATMNPARYLGLNHLGRLAPGMEASLFLFDRDIGSTLKVRQTILAGQVVYKA
jgi:N-acetylglucosamine-6-phosphate deacetylase